ncbi:MAG TPA: GNAT family N-acetyltransferase [Stackebrandtia sp.]|jgi:ribosomal protein S18 acetylase RimI-like enzyme|uniref:GNAT family N-acetyltransferase n=1 Tax=Stackebrandtia sp. TaxID=2023065 RepID=UPI002D2D9649|nr:GNAT family N-acetyltransferase [Stackebrandtia sp.]HZE38116.1 GNAT family N-acetyltransferase [Stackebrandtia sp.]
MDFEIRRARESELAAIGEVSVAAYDADGQLADGNEYVHRLRDAAFRAREAELLVAVDPDTGAAAGTVTICPPGSPMAEVSRVGELEFRMLAVAPAFQGRGVGRALVNACLERGRQLGCHSAVICTRGGGTGPAHRLYESLGFTRLPERDWSPRPGIDLVALRASL